jgi:signal transduction histidine kinase/DNA-binding response OmpR family regulator
VPPDPQLAEKTTLNMAASPERLALDFQRAVQELHQERLRTQQLLAEVERQNHELDRLRSSVHRESNSRLLAEEALDETRDRLQLAVEAAGLALWDWQLPSEQVFLTARWGEMLGDVSMDGYWDTKDLRERTHPEDRASLKALANKLLTGGQTHGVIQFRVRAADQWLWIESHGMVAEHDSQGHPIRLMGTHADISERKRVEAEGLRARELAEQASRAKSEFLANISHEVRTPLNALMGLTRLLMDSALNAEQRSWLDLMDSSAHALLGLLNDVLDLSRIEAGKLDIEKVPYRLHETLEELSTLYAGQAHAKSMDWKLQLASNVPDLVEGDPGRLRQVLANLLSNALKFTPKGGQIHVSARVETDARGERCLQLQVRDSGVGIAKDHQATIFDAFTQADASTARRFGGSGLGLAICSRLTHLMGGTIELKSELGLGSTFTVTLPLSEPLAANESPQSAPAELQEVAKANERFSGMTVLVAEDHPVNELLINQLLKRLGCRVLNARNGAEAVRQWGTGGVDLVLMDVQMPGTTGLQATRLIREQEILQGKRHTPIVAVTANAMKGDREACLAAGVDGYTPKPVSPQALIRAMDEALRRTSGLPVIAPQASLPEVEHKMPAAACALDLDKLRRRLDGDEVTLRQLAQAMHIDLGQRLHQLQKALQTQDPELAIAHAHGLKGSLGSMTAERGARLAKGLELAALGRDWSLFGRALPLMQAEAQKIDQSLNELLSGRPTTAG